MEYALLDPRHNQGAAGVSESEKEEEDGLWAELNHQQKREILLHRAQTAAWRGTTGPTRRPQPWHWNLLVRVLQQTKEEAIRFGHVVRDAAWDAWREQETRHFVQQSQDSAGLYARTAPDHQNYLLDFGIAGVDGTDYDPLRQTPGNEANRHNADNGFIMLPRFSNSAHYGAAANLDIYFGSLYSYYYHRGLVPILGKGMVQLVSLLFTLFLSVVLCVYVDWRALVKCVDESTCHGNFASYLHEHPFRSYSSIWSLLIVLIYIALFLLYAAFATWSCLQTMRQALHAKFVFEERLGISARKLQGGAVDWNLHVVDKLLELQRSGEYRVAIHGQDLDALVIANRILRKENFMVALFNRGLLNLKIPRLGNQVFFCSSLEWSLYFCILNFMFNHKYEIRPAFYLDHGALRRRFIACGLVHLVFSPFLLFFSALHFSLQNAYDWKSTKRYLGPREWSLTSKWLFREFNELQHHFESRLFPSYEAAEKYLALFGQSELMAAFGRILVFIAGSLGAVLFIFAAINDAILLHVKIAEWNLLWYAGMVGVVYSVGKAMIPSEETRPRRIRNLHAETDAALTAVANHTHYYMPHWKGRAHDEDIYKTIKSMFQFKAQLFVLEIASLLVAPYLLCFSLAENAESICEFIFLTKAELAGAGEVCGYATFNFEKFEDEAWEGRTMAHQAERQDSCTLSESILRTRNVDDVRRSLPTPRSRLGKMEKSFFSFQATHPTWRCSPSGQHLVDRVERYKEETSTALMKEQELHIDAAARQVEALATLQQRKLLSSIYVVDSHIPRVPSSADAGAGAFHVHSSHPLSASIISQRTVETPHSEQDQVHKMGASDHIATSSTLQTYSASLARDLPLATTSEVTRESSTPPLRETSSRVMMGAGSGLGLSSELKKILEMSTLDPEVSLLAGNSTDDDCERKLERQYMWLQRYHQHVAAQQGSTDSEQIAGRDSFPSSV